MKFLNFFLFFVDLFALLDPDPADQNQSGSRSETLKKTIITLEWRSMVIMCVKPAFTHISAISLSEILPRRRIFVCWLYGRHGNTPVKHTDII
jgi:hypothetical protein